MSWWRTKLDVAAAAAVSGGGELSSYAAAELGMVVFVNAWRYACTDSLRYGGIILTKLIWVEECTLLLLLLMRSGCFFLVDDVR